METTVAVVLGRVAFPFLQHRTSFEIRVIFSKFKSEGRDRTLARAGPHSGAPFLAFFSGKEQLH